MADNIYLSSSGIGALQEWTLGGTNAAITTGTTTGSTGFTFVVPSEHCHGRCDEPGWQRGQHGFTRRCQRDARDADSGAFTITLQHQWLRPAFGRLVLLTETATNDLYRDHHRRSASITPARPSFLFIRRIVAIHITLSIIPTTNNVRD